MSYSDFLNAIKAQDHEGIPVWFMRQAGRYMPEFSQIRNGRSIREMCKDTETVAHITELPVRKLGVDAAIIFHDILLPLEAMGLRVEYGKDGPSVRSNVMDLMARGKFFEYSKENDNYPLPESIHKFREGNPGVPLIGFSGGPITLASYIISEKRDGDLSLVRRMIHNEPQRFSEILRILTEMIIGFSKAQLRAGVSVIQIFDSWAGYLSGDMFSKIYSSYLREISAELSGLAPTIYFSTGTWHVQSVLEELGFDYLSVDWRRDILSYSNAIKESLGIQGNLDPALAASDLNVVKAEVMRIANGMKWKNNYIFNLGHGVPQFGSENILKEIVREVHSVTR